MLRVCPIFLLILVSCARSPADGASFEPLAPPTCTHAVAETIGHMANLIQWDRDLATACDEPGLGDAPSTGCRVQVIAPDGAASPMPEDREIHRALRVSGERALLLTDHQELLLHLPDGNTTTFMSSVAEPALDTSAMHLAYAALPDGATELEAGQGAHLMVRDLQTGRTSLISDDARDSQPYPAPNSNEVVFVSGRTGIASLWLGAPDREPRQLTNVGVTDPDDPNFVPVPSVEVAWRPGTRTLVFAARYDQDELWQVDIDSGHAERLGMGHLPMFDDTATLMSAPSRPADAPVDATTHTEVPQ